MGHWRQPVLLFILPKKPQEMNDFSSFLAVFFYGLMSQSLVLNFFNFYNFRFEIKPPVRQSFYSDIK